MQHQSQGLEKGLTAGTAGYLDRDISAADIERHIAAGRRMQSEAIAAFVKGGIRRLGVLIHLRPLRRGHPSRA